MRSHDSGSAGWRAAVNHLDDNLSISHASESLRKACTVRKTQEKNFSCDMAASFQSPTSVRGEVRRGQQISPLPPPPFYCAGWDTAAEAGARPPNPAVEYCFLPCPGTKGSARCHGASPASSCWKQTPAPSASSASPFLN